MDRGEEPSADGSEDTRSNTTTNDTSTETPLIGSVESLSDQEDEKTDGEPVVVRRE